MADADEEVRVAVALQVGRNDGGGHGEAGGEGGGGLQTAVDVFEEEVTVIVLHAPKFLAAVADVEVLVTVTVVVQPDEGGGLRDGRPLQVLHLR